eukprot:GFUD01017642.1.p1 GENE.GFUD01017642.1~~GFUD01017642.1.p1  ORF type:complete len:390 (+),score=74.64 GFUD01017642.1:307-1476(+)
MAANKPNLVQTLFYDGQHGDREYVVSCKSRTFTILTSPNLPTPAFTMVDWSLVRDLHLRMTDLQCKRLTYGGRKVRILGKISTTVQCIVNGVPMGNIQLKAHVIQDLYQLFDTHSIAGEKLSGKLNGPPLELVKENPTEPTDKIASTKKKRKRTAKLLKKSESEYSGESVPTSPSPSLRDPEKSPPSSPPTRFKGKWIHYRNYHAWDPVNCYAMTGELKHKWVDKETDEVYYERPDSFTSDGSFSDYSPDDVGPHSSDEYEDVYSNISTVRQNDPANGWKPLTEQTSGHQQLFKAKMESRPSDTFRRPRDTREQAEVLQYLTQDPRDPDVHGPYLCRADCTFLGLENLPPDCGYHRRWGVTHSCSSSCPGHWCRHCQRRYSQEDDDEEE